jgi:hypothetical protein
MVLVAIVTERINTMSSKQYCRACTTYHPLKDFQIVRDGKLLTTRQCAKSLAEEDRKHNKEQRAKKGAYGKGKSMGRI